MALWCLLLVGTLLVAAAEAQDCTHGDVRLVQYTNILSYRGRVEVCIQGVWGTVTDDGFDSREGRVICRQLGYSDLIVRPYPNAWFGQGTGLPIFMDNLRCNGNEQRLIDCSYDTPSNDYHWEDASVRCYTAADLNSTTCDTGDIRLIGGTLNREGRLELCFGGQWSTVTDDGFSTFDAIVACRMLGYLDGYGLAYTNAYFGQGSGFISLDNVGCYGSPFPLQKSLFECSYVMAVGDSHAEDVGIKCFTSATNPTCNLGALRLRNGNNAMEGRVEICIDGVWGTVSDDGWSSADAQVTCRQLGFAALGALNIGNNNAPFGQGSGPIFMKSVGCNGRNLKLLQCNFNARTTGDGHFEDAGVRCQAAVCTEAAVRLVNGSDSSEGRVELCYQGVWITICDRLWSIHEAQVVCNQLGYPNATEYAFPYINSYFGNGTVPYKIDEPRCLGTESNLLNCPYDTNVATCTSGDVAGVRCTPGNECTHGTIKLVDGPGPQEGRLELCLYGIWGTVSHNGFSIPDSWVVCRQLGYYNYSGRSYGGAFFGQGTGLVHMRNVACTGDEASILDCPYSRDTQYNFHNQDISVRCQVSGECTDGQVRIASSTNSKTTGLIQVCNNGVWGVIISTESWSGLNAQVICSQVGFDTYALAYAHSFFLSGINTIQAMENVQCSGNEGSIFNCSWNRPQADPTLYNENIGVRCFNESVYPACNLSDVRIVSGNTTYDGRAEICIDEQWGTICNNQWSEADANVFCGQAGHASTGATAVLTRSYSQYPGTIWLTDVVCSGKEENIMDCRLEGDTSSCNHMMDAGVICLPKECEDGQVMIVNGSTNEEGRVEVCQHGRWGTVCDSNWGINEAQVVCRQLGIQVNSTVYALKQSAFGNGDGPIWLNNVDCTGDETNILQCRFDTNTMTCDHTHDTGVKCSKVSECSAGVVRLVGGDTSYEGQVQVCYNGVWGSVASDGWEAPDAQVICRQLGFPDIVGVPLRGVNYGSTSIPIVMSNVSCIGNEPNLTACDFDPDASDHTYTQNAGVRCFPHACDNGDVRLIGGSTETQGRVEICIGGNWGTVANYGWNNAACNVVCMQLFDQDRLTGATPLNDTTLYGVSQDPVHLHSVVCTGNETSLLRCRLNSETDGDTHDTDAGCQCTLKELQPTSTTTTTQSPTPTSQRPTQRIPTPERTSADSVVYISTAAVIGGILVIVIVALFIVLIALIVTKKNKSINDTDNMNLVGAASFPYRND